MNDRQLADIGRYSWPSPEATFYGRHVWSTGEDGDNVVVAGHGRRALAALNAHQRGLQGHGWRAWAKDLHLLESWVHIVETCGCTEETHARHLAEAEEHGGITCDDDCDDYGLPPCNDDYGWATSSAKPDDPGAVPLTEVSW